MLEKAEFRVSVRPHEERKIAELRCLGWAAPEWQREIFETERVMQIINGEKQLASRLIRPRET